MKSALTYLFLLALLVVSVKGLQAESPVIQKVPADKALVTQKVLKECTLHKSKALQEDKDSDARLNRRRRAKSTEVAVAFIPQLDFAHNDFYNRPDLLFVEEVYLISPAIYFSRRGPPAIVGYSRNTAA